MQNTSVTLPFRADLLGHLPTAIGKFYAELEKYSQDSSDTFSEEKGEKEDTAGSIFGSDEF